MHNCLPVVRKLKWPAVMGTYIFCNRIRITLVTYMHRP